MIRQHKDADGTPNGRPLKRPKTLTSVLYELPEELLDLIFSHLKGLNYYQFRMLRSHPRFKRYMDGRFLVLKNFQFATTFFHPVGNYTGNPYVTQCTQAIEAIEKFQEQHRSQANELTVYLEFLQVKGWRGKSNVGKLIMYCHERGIYLVIFDKGGQGINAQNRDLMQAKFEVIQNVLYETTEFDNLMAMRAPNSTMRFYKYPETITIKYKALPPLDNFLQMNGVLWNYTIENLKLLKLYNKSQHTLAFCLKQPLLQYVKKVIIVKDSNRDTTKPREISKLKLPMLESLNILGCDVSQFTNNEFSSLKKLAIEGPPVSEFSEGSQISLSFSNNYSPKLEILDISVSSLNEFISQRGSLDQLKRFRLDTDFSGMYGTMEYLFNTFCHATHISFVPRGDKGQEMMELLMSGLYDCSKLESLLIADHSDHKWVELLEKKLFPKLRTLRYYNANKNLRIMPQLQAPNLELMVLFNTKIEKLQVRDYLGPLRIVFTDADDCKPDYYWRVHFSGARYLSREACNSEYTQEWVLPTMFDSNILTRSENTISLKKREPYKRGTIDLRYHERENIKDTVLETDHYLIDHRCDIPVPRRTISRWWY
jgi:hypothetical protein